jgi:hypothetical protein
MTGSEDHRILTFLRSQGMEVLQENCLVPVLDILLNEPVAFMVTPRQVNVVYFSYSRANAITNGIIRNIIRIMHSLFKVSLNGHSAVILV